MPLHECYLLGSFHTVLVWCLATATAAATDRPSLSAGSVVLTLPAGFVLQALKASWGNFTGSDTWRPGAPCSTLEGVTCDGADSWDGEHVTAMYVC